MLSGCLLYSGRQKLEVLAKRDKVIFPDSHWTGVSKAAQDFVSKLLRVCPSSRLTPTEALNHEWISPVKIVDKCLFTRIIRLYANNGQILSGAYMNAAGQMLGYRRAAAYPILPLAFPMLAAQGFKLDRMILNAVRFTLFINQDFQSDIVAG